MSLVQIDEMGPIFIGNVTDGTVKIWVMICVEVVTRQIHLCMLKDQSTPSFIQTLEILQNKCGQLSTIILDHASTHCTVHKEHCSNTVNKIVNSDGKDRLAKSDIHFVIAESKRHQKVGLAE